MEAFSDARVVLRAVELIAACGVLISTLELLWNWRDFTGERLYAWKVLRSRGRISRSVTVARALDAVLDMPGIGVVLVVRLIAIVALFANAFLHPAAHAFALATVVATSFALSYRSIFGQDGSDQMSSLIFVSLLIASLTPSNAIVREAALAFIAAQAVLSYLVAGIAKAAGPVWRNGDATLLIFNTQGYGLESVARVLFAVPAAARLLTWTVVVMECTFPLVFVAGPRWCWIFLGWGLAFHLLNAVVMGLNSFLWAFGAAYPAIIFCLLRLDHWLH